MEEDNIVAKALKTQLTTFQEMEKQNRKLVKDNEYLRYRKDFYYIPIYNSSIELSVFWLSDTESRINELRFSDSVSLSFKRRLTSVTCFWGEVA